jgi:glycosyltransferase involved in cell wall biosynthesis
VAKIKNLTVLRNPHPEQHERHKILVSIPFTGLVRFEWHMAMQTIVYPTNWLHTTFCPAGFEVGVARNEAVQAALGGGFDWLFFIDHDVLLPPDIYIKLRKYMTAGDKPIVAGLYYTKASTPEPLIYRGRGTGPYYDWNPGDGVWADATGMGCTLINMRLFRAMKPPWFVTPRDFSIDASGYSRATGTEDIYWYDRVINEGVIEKAGFKIPDPKLPVYVDTSIMCEHIDNDGRKFPSCMEGAHLVNHQAALKAIGKRPKRMKSA